VGVSRDCPNFLSTPIISITGKATNFKFCTHILSIDQNKSPLQISGKVAGCIVRTLETFQGMHHILGASRGLLCDSSAVLSGYACSFPGCSPSCLFLNPDPLQSAVVFVFDPPHLPGRPSAYQRFCIPQ